MCLAQGFHIEDTQLISVSLPFSSHKGDINKLLWDFGGI